MGAELVSMHDVDFRALGFKCGLEIHQQLLSDRKLFCRCPPVYRNDPPHYEIVRHMRPTLSEMGTYDGTALMEFKTKKNVTYQFFRDTTCSYEIDDTPPFEMDPRALEISMVIARAMECSLVDEVHVSRKQYLDGSIPTGFQRTAIISLGGHVPWKNGREIEIRQISIEEDACREISDRGHEIIFRTDRLSIPLIEVVTEPNAETPAEAGEMAEVLGWVMRSTGLVRRGSGSTRQDVNVSIEGGRRVEIKGVPRIELIPPITAGEAVRQYNLLKINNELLERGLNPETMDADGFSTMKFEDVTEIFEGRRIEMFDQWYQGVVGAGNDIDIKAVLIPGFKGIFSHPTHGDQTFADEVGGRLRVIACLDRMPNLITSDDVPMRGITEEDMEAVRSRLSADEQDTVVMVWGPKEDTLTGVKEVYIRSKEAFYGVPHETRQVITPDITTFERILPGPDRMYPDTDRPPITVTREMVESVNAQVPRPWWEDEEEMVKNGVPKIVAHRLVVSRWMNVYRRAVEAGAPPRFTALFLMEDLRAAKRSGSDILELDDEEFIELLKLVGQGKLTRKGATLAMEWAADTGDKLSSAVHDLKLAPISKEEATKVIRNEVAVSEELVKLFGQGREKPLMGRIMDAIGPRYEGCDVLKILRSQVAAMQ
ncbi:MAG: Glu-tRNA(Gln) amidotransferase subunit GatE [Candidatus Thermoplasmatota archaeon]|nr:Glu-tRNA(Gln) amidotransferase subunit GatE [Candidatus Thermoplasmatota archaeon]